MSKINVYNIITEEGRNNIKQAKKRLDQLLEITQCIICNESKPLNEFAEDKNGHLGFSNVCQECSKKGISHTKKKCEKCGEFKRYNRFYRIRRKDYSNYCIECTRKMIDERGITGITKQCSECGEVKPSTTEYFYVTITCKDFLKPVCKKCDNIRKIKSKNMKKQIEKI
jgi:hypothetical protein